MRHNAKNAATGRQSVSRVDRSYMYCYNGQNTHQQMACARGSAASGSASYCGDNECIVGIIVCKRLT
jgi:hypothetical protein